jgi:hypothetical protein
MELMVSSNTITGEQRFRPAQPVGGEGLHDQAAVQRCGQQLNPAARSKYVDAVYFGGEHGQHGRGRPTAGWSSRDASGARLNAPVKRPDSSHWPLITGNSSHFDIFRRYNAFKVFVH